MSTLQQYLVSNVETLKCTKTCKHLRRCRLCAFNLKFLVLHWCDVMQIFICIRVLFFVEMVAARTPITFHIGETSLTIPFSLDSAKGLSSAISGLLTTFKEKEQAGRPQRWSNMEYRQTEDGVFFEVFCNPNAHATAFQAKYLITINDEKLRITSEGQLSSLKNDVDTYIDVQGWLVGVFELQHPPVGMHLQRYAFSQSE